MKKKMEINQLLHFYEVERNAMKSFCFKLELLKIYYLDLKKVIFETTHVRVMKFCGPLQSV